MFGRFLLDLFGICRFLLGCFLGMLKHCFGMMLGDYFEWFAGVACFHTMVFCKFQVGILGQV